MEREAKEKAKELKKTFGKKKAMTACKMIIEETRSKFWYMVKSNL